MAKVIGADHEFHDAAYASGWAARFQPTPDRLRLFDLILAELQARVAPDGLVMELGMGPGYLAEYLLAAMPRLRYCGVDFSRAMLTSPRSGSAISCHGLITDRLISSAPRGGLTRRCRLTPSSPRGRCTTWAAPYTSRLSTPAVRRPSAAGAFCSTAISPNRLVPCRITRLVGSR